MGFRRSNTRDTAAILIDDDFLGFWRSNTRDTAAIFIDDDFLGFWRSNTRDTAAIFIDDVVLGFRRCDPWDATFVIIVDRSRFGFRRRDIGNATGSAPVAHQSAILGLIEPAGIGQRSTLRGVCATGIGQGATLNFIRTAGIGQGAFLRHVGTAEIRQRAIEARIVRGIGFGIARARRRHVVCIAQRRGNFVIDARRFSTFSRNIAFGFDLVVDEFDVNGVFFRSDELSRFGVVEVVDGGGFFRSDELSRFGVVEVVDGGGFGEDCFALCSAIIAAFFGGILDAFIPILGRFIRFLLISFRI